MLALRELQWAIEEGGSSKPGRETLRVGFIPNAMFAGLPQAIALFVQKHPEIELNLKEFNVPECAAAISQGEIDVAFTLNHSSFASRNDSEEVVVDMLHEDHFGAFMSTSLKLPKTRGLSAETLSELPWLLPSYESSIRQVFDNWFIQNGATPPEAVLEITPMTLGMELLKVMPCLALLPKRLSKMTEYAHIEPVHPMNFEVAARFVYASRKSQSDRTAVRNLLNCLRLTDLPIDAASTR